MPLIRFIVVLYLLAALLLGVLTVSVVDRIVARQEVEQAVVAEMLEGR